MSKITRLTITVTTAVEDVIAEDRIRTAINAAGFDVDEVVVDEDDSDDDSRDEYGDRNLESVKLYKEINHSL